MIHVKTENRHRACPSNLQINNKKRFSNKSVTKYVSSIYLHLFYIIIGVYFRSLHPNKAFNERHNSIYTNIAYNVLRKHNTEF